MVNANNALYHIWADFVRPAAGALKPLQNPLHIPDRLWYLSRRVLLTPLQIGEDHGKSLFGNTRR